MRTQDCRQTAGVRGDVMLTRLLFPFVLQGLVGLAKLLSEPGDLGLKRKDKRFF